MIMFINVVDCDLFFIQMEDPSLLEESSTFLDPNEPIRAAPQRLGWAGLPSSTAFYWTRIHLAFSFPVKGLWQESLEGNGSQHLRGCCGEFAEEMCSYGRQTSKILWRTQPPSVLTAKAPRTIDIDGVGIVFLYIWMLFFFTGRPGPQVCLHHLFPRRPTEEPGQENLWGVSAYKLCKMSKLKVII